MEFTPEKFNQIKWDAESYYESLKSVWCPYFKVAIYFNSKGWEHLIFKDWNKTRPIVQNHSIQALAKALLNHLSDTTTWIPDESDAIYKKLFLPEEAEQSIQLSQISGEDVPKYEMAYIMGNVMNLKYGYYRSLKKVSTVGLTSSDLNKPFLDLFIVCRNACKTPELNQRLKEKIKKTFGDSNDPWLERSDK